MLTVHTNLGFLVDRVSQDQTLALVAQYLIQTSTMRSNVLSISNCKEN